MEKKKKNKNFNNKNKKTKQNNEQKQQGFATLNQVTGSPEQHSHHSKLEVLKTKEIKEPKATCFMCNKVIENIASAMYSPKDELVHFDCVLNNLKETTKLSQNQSISYIGKGTFAICEKGEDGKYSIVERIVYESPEQVLKIKEFVEAQKI